MPFSVSDIPPNAHASLILSKNGYASADAFRNVRVSQISDLFTIVAFVYEFGRPCREP